MYHLILTFLFISCLHPLVVAQQYSFYGVLLLHGKKENAISYRIDFTEKDGKIQGTSTTDLTGAHETKNIISGTYDAKTKTLSFREKEIIYTKSALSKDVFCFVQHASKVKLGSKGSKLEGKFNGYFENGKSCINGTLSLIGTPLVEKLLRIAEQKIATSKELDEETKKKVQPKQLFDSLQTQQLAKGELLHVFLGSDDVTFTIWDKNKEDGDIITLWHNEKPVLQHFPVKNNPHQITIPLSESDNIFTIEAINEGSLVPNTAMIVLEGDRKIEFQSNLKKGEKATVRIVRRAPELRE